MHLSKKKQLATTFMFVCFELFYLSTFQVRLDEQKRTEPNIRKTGTNPTLNRFTASVYMTTAVALNDMKCEWKFLHTLWGNPTTAWTTTSAIFPREDWKFLWRHFNSISSIVLEPIANQYLSNVGWGVYQWDQTGPEKARERRRRRLFELEETKEPQKMTETSRTSWMTCFSKIHGRQECFQN